MFDYMPHWLLLLFLTHQPTPLFVVVGSLLIVAFELVLRNELYHHLLADVSRTINVQVFVSETFLLVHGGMLGDALEFLAMFVKVLLPCVLDRLCLFGTLTTASVSLTPVHAHLFSL